MIYRSAQPTDADAIVAFQLAMAKETESIDLDGDVVARGVAAVFRDAALGRYFVAEHDRRIAGCLMITFEWSDWRDGMVWWIQSVYIVPEFRRQGLYAGLYLHVRELVENDPGVRGIRLYVDRRNVVAQEVYRRLEMDGEHYLTFEWMK